MFKSIIILLLYIQPIINGQADKNLNDDKSPSSFEFKWSNDFEYQTDYYYTNGFAFEIVTPIAKIKRINSILVPTKLNDVDLFAFTLVQDIFTPKEKFNVENQLNGDRPFAAYILLGLKKVTFRKTDRIRTYSELQIGVLGPAAFGEEVQNGIHNNLPTSAPVVGWENQISNSFMLNYSASIEKQFYYNNWFELSGTTSAKLGLPFTSADISVKTRIGFFDLFPENFEFLSPQKWQLYLSLSARGSVIGYNATLQGGLFSKSIYTLKNINRFIGYANIGLTLLYKKIKLEYVQHFNNPEFPSALSHSWGYLLIKVEF